MAGGSLVASGDLQIGADGDTPILMRGPHSPAVTVQNHLPDALWLVEFNPLVAPEWITTDEPYPGRAGVRQGVDTPSTKTIPIEMVLHYTSQSALKSALNSLRYHLEPLSLNIFDTANGQPRFEEEISWMMPDGTKWVIYGRFRNVGTKDFNYVGRHRLHLTANFECAEPIMYEATPITADIPYLTAVSDTFPETDQGPAGYVYYPYFFTAPDGESNVTGILSRAGYVCPIWPWGGPEDPLTIEATTATGFNAPARWKLTIDADITNPTVWTRVESYGNASYVQYFGLAVGLLSGVSFADDPAIVLGYRQEVRTAGNRYLDPFIMVGSSWWPLYGTMELYFTGLGLASGGAHISYQRGKWMAI